RDEDVLGRGRADGLHPGGVALAGRQADHRAAERDEPGGEPDRAGAEGGRGGGHDAGARALRGDGVRGGEPLREEPAAAGAGADRGGAPRPPGGAGAGRARAVYGAAGLTQLPPRPATPVRAAASATASATRWATSGSRTPGTMWSAVMLCS